MNAWQLIVLLGAVVLVYALLLPRKTSSAAQTNMMTEIEETMEHFTMEIEEENKELIKIVADMIKDHEIQNSKLLGRMEALEKQVQHHLHESIRIAAPPATIVPPATITPAAAYATDSPASAAQQSTEGNTAENNRQMSDDGNTTEGTQLPIKIRYTDLFQLYEQGKSIDMIAKKLGKNKGEIQLIIQLARREEQFRA